jgi:hypothetical protein
MSIPPLHLFPALVQCRFKNVNLDRAARERQQELPRLSSPVCLNPFLDPVVCEGWIKKLALEHDCDFTYGGYLEDRRFLWATSYLDSTKAFLHLGVDFNLPYGTEVAALFDGEVVRVDDDLDQEGGWGPRVIIRPDNSSGLSRPVCIFAHLTTPQVRVGDRIKAGSVIAAVGKAPLNGNWFPHLHVQTVEEKHFSSLLQDGLRSLDGYGSENSRADLLTRFPNPLQFDWLVGSLFCS